MFIIRLSVDGQYYFIYRSRNGKTVVTSETYTQLHNCRKGIDSCKTNADISNFRLKHSVNRQHYFVLVASNGQILFTSETYTRKYNALKAIRMLSEKMKSAIVKDLSNS